MSPIRISSGHVCGRGGELGQRQANKLQSKGDHRMYKEQQATDFHLNYVLLCHILRVQTNTNLLFSVCVLASKPWNGVLSILSPCKHETPSID